jgi:DNA-binding MarR family transcriptional regulator
MITDTGTRILAYIKEKNEATAREIIDFLGFSPQAVFKQLGSLAKKGLVIKIGSPPKVFYRLASTAQKRTDEQVDEKIRKIIEENYLIVSPAGEILRGMKGFVYWCEQQKLGLAKTASEYEKTLAKYARFKKNGLIGGMEKLLQTFTAVNLDKMYYLDFYSIERFGKTKLGALLLYAKQSQSRALIKEICDMARERVLSLIEKYNVDAVGFIPPTVARKLQFQKEMERLLRLNLPKIQLMKVSGEVAVPQKTLSKLSDRIENANKSVFVGSGAVYKNIILLDDAVGSGATMNETARKIKEKGMCSGKIIGLAIAGSFKGFDVIAEV